MVEVWQGGKIGVGRYASMTGRKMRIFVDFRPPDTENFVKELQASHRETKIHAVRPQDSFSATMVALAPWSYLQSTASPWPTFGFRERWLNAFTFLKNPICMV